MISLKSWLGHGLLFPLSGWGWWPVPLHFPPDNFVSVWSRRWLTDLGNETQALVTDRNPGFRVKAEPGDGVMPRVKWMEPPRLTQGEIKGRCGARAQRWGKGLELSASHPML